MNALANISDEKRVARATKQANKMQGPLELGHCQHGKLFSYRWVWPVGATPEDGDARIESQNCKRCVEE